MPLVRENEDKRRLLLVGVQKIVWKMKRRHWLEVEMPSRMIHKLAKITHVCSVRVRFQSLARSFHGFDNH